MARDFQVVLEWGEQGLAASPAVVTIVVDALGTEHGRALATAAEADPARAVVLRAGLDDAAGTAAAVLAAQHERGDRVSVAIVAAGERWPDGSTRFGVADHLAAGALVDALCDVGIDFHSPACAIAAAAHGSLRGAVRHLVSAARH